MSRKRIINSSIAKNIKVDILGSKRFGDTNNINIQPAKKFSNRIFVIPEGIESECKILFDFLRIIRYIEIIWSLYLSFIHR